MSHCLRFPPDDKTDALFFGPTGTRAELIPSPFLFTI